MNQLLEINVIKYNSEQEGLDPLIVVSFNERTPNGMGGFGYPLSPNEAKILIMKLQDVVKQPEVSQLATLEDIHPLNKDKK